MIHHAALAALLAASITPGSQPLQEAPPRSPQLQVLNRFVGTWDEVTTSKAALWTAETTTMRGRNTRRWILDKRMIENRGRWDSGMDFLHLMTWDAAKKEYRQWYYDRDNVVPMESRGEWNAGTQTLTFKGTFGDGIRTLGRQQFQDKDTFAWTFVATDRQGRVVLDMEGKCTRQKE